MLTKAIVSLIASAISLGLPIVFNDQMTSNLLTLVFWSIIIVAVFKLAKEKKCLPHS